MNLAGTCVITISQDGLDATPAPTYYAAAPSITTTITVVAGAPSEVQNITARSGDRSLTLTWIAPALDGGAPISTYNITWRPLTGGGAATAISIPASTTSYVVTGLSNGIGYDVLVRATNAAGRQGP